MSFQLMYFLAMIINNYYWEEEKKYNSTQNFISISLT